MNPAPKRLSDAWEIELEDVRQQGLSDQIPADDILAYRRLYYGGAAAMMAMTVYALASSDAPYYEALDQFFTRMKLEISEYLESTDWPEESDDA